MEKRTCGVAPPPGFGRAPAPDYAIAPELRRVLRALVARVRASPAAGALRLRIDGALARDPGAFLDSLVGSPALQRGFELTFAPAETVCFGDGPLDAYTGPFFVDPDAFDASALVSPAPAVLAIRWDTSNITLSRWSIENYTS